MLIQTLAAFDIGLLFVNEQVDILLFKPQGGWYTYLSEAQNIVKGFRSCQLVLTDRICNVRVTPKGATLIGLLRNWPVKNWPVI